MKPGIYAGQAMREYLSLKALSSGMCHALLAQSPLHAWIGSPWNPNRNTEATSEMDIGTYAHAMLLEGAHAGLVVIDAEDWRTKAAKEERDAARADGKLPILARKLPDVEAMVLAAKMFIADSEIAGVFDTGSPEQTIVFDDDGLLCKARPDWLTADGSICLSYKTTAGSAQPDAWIRTQLPSYDIATAFYQRAVESTIDGGACNVVHLVQEQAAPYSCSLVSMSPALFDLAYRKLDRAVALWHECQRTGKYPAYTSRICYAEPKPWQEAEFAQNEAMRDYLTKEELEGGVPA